MTGVRRRHGPWACARAPIAARPRHRGYLLLEALISGAIVAVGLLGVAIQLGAARDAEVRAERRGVATVLAKAGIDDQRARPFASLREGDDTKQLSAGNGTYARRVSIRDGRDTLAFGVDGERTEYTVLFKQIVVDVSFGAARPVTVRLETRVYEEAP